MNKKIVSIVLIFILTIAVLLVGCSSSSTNNKKISIEFWHVNSNE